MNSYGGSGPHELFTGVIWKNKCRISNPCVASMDVARRERLV